MAKLFFAYGLGNGLYFPLGTGGTTILLPDRPMPEKVFETIDRYQPTVFYSVPTSYAALCTRRRRPDAPAWDDVRMCVSAGETLPRHVFLRWRERFRRGYPRRHRLDRDSAHLHLQSARRGQGRGAPGQVVPGFEARIVDDDGRPTARRRGGHADDPGDSIAAGYWNKHEATKQTFCGEWINTHDKFMVDQDGYFWYSGPDRRHDQSQRPGVWPTEVEGMLHGASGGAGKRRDRRRRRRRACSSPWPIVVLKDGREPSPELAHELQEFVKRNTAPHKYPRAVIFVDSLPKTATGKIKRFELRERAAADGVLRAQQR